MKREVVPIVRDGNCFYRSISFELLGTQNDHTAVRNSVVELISCNKEVFTAYFIPEVADTTIETHLEAMSKPSTWATQLEVKGTATLFQMPILLGA